jgi:hypothetical protein
LQDSRKTRIKQKKLKEMMQAKLAPIKTSMRSFSSHFVNKVCFTFWKSRSNIPAWKMLYLLKYQLHQVQQSFNEPLYIADHLPHDLRQTGENWLEFSVWNGL